jgi:hypothetical protein
MLCSAGPSSRQRAPPATGQQQRNAWLDANHAAAYPPQQYSDYYHPQVAAPGVAVPNHAHCMGYPGQQPVQVHTQYAVQHPASFSSYYEAQCPPQRGKWGPLSSAYPVTHPGTAAGLTTGAAACGAHHLLPAPAPASRRHSRWGCCCASGGGRHDSPYGWHGGGSGHHTAGMAAGAATVAATAAAGTDVDRVTFVGDGHFAASCIIVAALQSSIASSESALRIAM